VCWKTIQNMLKSSARSLNYVYSMDGKVILSFNTAFHFLLESQKSFLKAKDCFWAVLENYAKKVPCKESNQSAYDIVQNHLTLPNNISKLRAWIRISLTKKMLVTDIKNAVSVVKKIEGCYFKWSITRNDTFSAWLSVIKSLDRVDFNLLVKESTLNLSDRSVDWLRLIQGNKIFLDRFVPYLNIYSEEDEILKGESNLDKELVRQIGFVEDENIRLRKLIHQQFNTNSKLEIDLNCIMQELSTVKLYVSDLECEVIRLQKEMANYK
jgi:hypothetical protein